MDSPLGLEKLLANMPGALIHEEEFLREMCRRARLHRVKRGDYLLRTGEMCDRAYFINKGLFVNLYVGEKGNECVTGFSSETMYPFLSAISFFTRQPSDFEIRAIEEGELVSFSREDLEALSLRYPLFSNYCQHAMMLIINKLYTMFAVRQTSTSEEFVRYLYARCRWIVNRVPDKYIAQYMGVSDSWYCKLKRKALVS